MKEILNLKVLYRVGVHTVCRMYRALLFLVFVYGCIHGMQFHNKGDVPRLYHPRFLTYEEPYNIEFKYHNYDQMSRFLRATSLRFQNLTALYSIGKSVKGNVILFKT